MWTCAGKAHRNPSPASLTSLGCHADVWHFQGAFSCCQTPAEARSGLAQSTLLRPHVQARGHQAQAAASSPLSWSSRASCIWSPDCPRKVSLEQNTAQFVAWVCWIPGFWPQKIACGSIKRMPGLQSLGSLTAAPRGSPIEPLITRSRSASPHDSCLCQGSGWLVLF